MAKNTKSGARVIAEAPESNAGDDFHVLWAARKSLELLKIGRTDLKCITIEGPDVDESEQVDSTGEKLLSIDIAEYYEGTNLKDSSKVIFSQLKYSTRRANVSYTLSRLCEGRKSILKRLATTFKGYINKFGREVVLKKLNIKLVSNRPVDKRFQTKLKQIQAYLEGNSNRLTKYTLTKEFTNYKKELDKLYKNSKLKSAEFADFLRVLDFDDCGTDSRFFQKQQLIQTIGSYDSYEIKNQYNGLYMLIKDKMLPEYRKKNSITLEDLLAEFQLGNLESLFPVPPKLEEIEGLIERTQLKEIAGQLCQKDQNIYCLHGGAGVGKSTIASSINKYLPHNSITIIYDCYGQGTYYDESAIRHTYNNAITQICNDLALEVGSPFLLSRGLPEYAYMSECKRRLEIATEILRQSFPDALLTIIIDAADNSVVASESKNDKCFVRGLSSLQNLPSGCNIVFTARTGRISGLVLNDKVLEIPIRPFCLDETREFLTNKYPDATDEQVEEFHQLTHGTPRVQSYSMENKENIDQVFEFLKPHGKTVNNLIAAQIEEAKKKLGNKDTVDSLLKGIINLPRPVPVDIVSSLSEVEEQTVIDFCFDSWSGIVYENETISFRDEDFENYLRKQYSPDKEYFGRISEYLLQNVTTSEYASSQIGMALFHGERYSQLQEIVLNEKYLDVIQDPLKKREVFVKRSRFALQSCSHNADKVMFFKLLLLCAEASKTDQTRLNIISNNIDLVSEFSDLSTVHKLFFEITSDVHYGAASLECAAIFSRDPKTYVFAKRYLHQAESWIAMRSRLSDEASREYNISLQDIAGGVEAVLRMEGIEKAESWLRQWRPKDKMLTVLSILFNRVLNRKEDPKQIKAWINCVKRPDVLLILVVKLHQRRIPHNINVKELSKRVIKIFNRKQKLPPEFLQYVIDFCEYLAEKKICLNEIKEILRIVNPQPPEHVPRFYSTNLMGDDDVRKMNLCFRTSCLLATLNNEEVKVEMFIPRKPDRADTTTRRKDRIEESKIEEFRTLYQKILPIYKLRADIIAGKFKGNVVKQAREPIESINSDYSFSYQHRHIEGIYNHVAGILSGLISYTSQRSQLITTLFESCQYRDVSMIAIGLTLANTSSSFKDTHETSLSLLSKIDQHIISNKFNATEEIDNYIKCARIAIRIDKMEAEVYFQKAVESASEIDYEAYRQIESLFFLSKNITSSIRYPMLAYETGRFIEHCSIRLSGYDKFPWDIGIAIIRNLDFPTALSTSCRWDHKNYTGITENWSTHLLLSLEKKHLIERQVAGLSTFDLFDYRWEELIELLIKEYKGNKALVRQLLNYAVKDIQTVCPIVSRRPFLERLLKILEEHGIKEDSVTTLKEFYDFLSSLDNSHNGEELKYSSNSSFSKTETNGKRIGKLVKQTNVNSVNDIQQSLNKLVKDGDYNYNIVDKFLDQLMEKCTVSDYISHLNAYISIKSESLSYYSFERGLKARLEAWELKQTVQKWKSDTFEKVIEKRFTEHFSASDYLDIKSLTDLADLFGKSALELTLILKKLFSEKADQLSAEILFQSTKIFRELIDEDQSVAVIKWAVKRWNKEIDDNVSEGEWRDELKPSSEMPENYAFYLRYCLGHPYKSIRWRAVHALRRLALFNDTELLDVLIRERDRKDNSVFQHSKYTFYWLSSKLWLFLALNKIAAERPELIIKYSKLILKEALNKQNAHLLIRNYAKSICLHLLDYSKVIFSIKEVKQLEDVLVPRSYITKGEGFVETQTESIKNKDSELGFDFDAIDTIPYWYDPLGNVFNISGRQIAKRADEYICDNWNYSDNSKKSDLLNVSSGDFYSTSNGHGDIPSIENLHIYYEYHSMFFVANDLIENYPTLNPKDYWYSWEEWIDRWICMESDWLLDMRDPTPLKKRFWRFTPNEKNREWYRSISSEELDNKLMLSTEGGQKWIVVACNYARYNREDYERVRISSSLVDSSKANALMRALQTCENPHDYKLPEDGEGDMEYDVDGFVLKGWLKTEYGSREKEAEMDHYAMTLKKTQIKMDNRFLNWIKRSKIDEEITLFQNWSDFNDGSRYPAEFGSKGYWLCIKKDKLSQFLHEIDYNLILETEIYRSEKYGIEDFRYIPSSHKIYLINKNGKIETINGSFKFG